jgi:hypothetical protein
LQHRTPAEGARRSGNLVAFIPELEVAPHAVFHDARIASKRQRSSGARKILPARSIKGLQAL